MRGLMRSCLISLLIVSLIEVPVFGAPARALGVVLAAEHAFVSDGAATSGSTVFDGDRLATEAPGSLRVRVGQTQIFLREKSAAVLRQSNGEPVATLHQGTVVLAAASADAFELRAAEARIRPRVKQPILAQVTIVGPHELVVTSNRGQLDVTIGEETQVVAENTSYRVEIEPEVPNPQGGPPRKAAKSKFILVALVLIGAGAIAAIVRAMMSPDN